MSSNERELRIKRRLWLMRHPGIVERLAASLGVSRQMIYMVLAGRKASARIEAELGRLGAPGFRRINRA